MYFNKNIEYRHVFGGSGELAGMEVLNQSAYMSITSRYCQTVFLKWLHHFTFVVAVYEISSYFTSSLALGSINVFHFHILLSIGWCHIVVLIVFPKSEGWQEGLP